MAIEASNCYKSPNFGEFWLKRNVQFEENGVAVIEDFYNEAEVNELFKASTELCRDAPEEDRRTFQAVGNRAKHLKDTYFLESSNKIRYFYEADALGENGELRVDITKALNKVRV